ncbi:hypothetical protein [Thermococcus sp. CX2]|uniref:hypothetical protein n=1 Tax=Thermococcus sp. CX2 TaxID=163006 RepID=UPI00197DC974|nr:hypothetical protein [Thermococcus sp. CX2]
MCHKVWKDKVFWILAVGGFLVALAGIFVESSLTVIVVGNTMMFFALVYLAIKTFEKRCGGQKEKS